MQHIVEVGVDGEKVHVFHLQCHVSHSKSQRDRTVCDVHVPSGKKFGGAMIDGIQDNDICPFRKTPVRVKSVEAAAISTTHHILYGTAGEQATTIKITLCLASAII